MITAVNTNTVTRSNVKSEGQFRINATGKAFRILSDGLYSDKITAIIRELSCNAYDAHVAGNRMDKPFMVQLPSKLESIFRLRDYGIGLSHSDIINVYTTYFQSTKTDSNDYIGCLGLGSKSPFSYVDNFSIISYFNGEKRVYNAFINEQETPTIALLNTSDTTEMNGIEVSFPVKNEDIYHFTNKAQSVFFYFKMKPEICGNIIEIKKPEYLFQGTGWGLRKERNRGVMAIMGNVAYPLSNFPATLTKNQKALLNTGLLDIDFGIGELEVSASRESLSYNPATIKNVTERLESILKEITAIVSEKIKGCKTLWEARMMARELVHGELSSLKDLIEDGVLTWNGHSVGQNMIEIPDALRDLSIRTFYATDSSKYAKTKIKSDLTHVIQINSKIRIYVADIKGGGIRCKQLIYNSASNYNDSFSVAKVYLLTGSAEQIRVFKNHIGIDNIENVSTLPRIKGATTSPYNLKNSKKMLVYDYNAQYSGKDTWKVEDIDVNAGGIYVVIERYKIQGCRARGYMENIAGHLESIGIDLKTIRVVGVKYGHSSKLFGGKWVSLMDYVTQQVQEYIVKNGYDKQMSKHNNLQNILGSNGSHYSNVKKLNSPAGSVIDIYVNEIADIEKQLQSSNGKTMEVVVRLAKDYRIPMDKKDDTKLTYEWSDIIAKYPMLTYVDSYYTWDNKEHKKVISNYIKLVENK